GGQLPKALILDDPERSGSKGENRKINRPKIIHDSSPDSARPNVWGAAWSRRASSRGMVCIKPACFQERRSGSSSDPGISVAGRTVRRNTILPNNQET